MNKLLCTCFIYFFLFSGQAAYCQVSEDSLRAEINKATDDTVKARLYNRLFNLLAASDYIKAKQAAQEGLHHTTTMKWPKGIAVFKQNLGQLFSNNGEYDSALFYYNEALAVHLKNKDAINTSSTYNNMGAAAQNIKSDYATAANYYFKAKQYAEEGQDIGLQTTAVSNIAKVYSLQQDSAKAIQYSQQAVAIAQGAGNNDLLANTLESLGTAWYKEKKYDSARYYYNQAVTLYEQSGNSFGLASALSNQVLTFGSDYRKIIETRLRAQELYKESAPLHLSAITNTGNLGNAYFDLVRYDSLHTASYGGIIPDNKELLLARAQEYLKSAIQLCEQMGENDTRASFLGNLAEVQAYSGDYKNAYFNFKTFSELTDSIYSQESKNKIAAAESQQETDKKNAELAVKQLTLSNQRKILWGLAAGLMIVGLLGFLLYRQSRLRKKTNERLALLNAELAQANSVKTKFFGILSHDLRGPVARLINFLHLQKEAPELLTGKQKEEYEQKITSSAKALLDNMENILLWSKGQMEQFKPEKKNIPVADLFLYIREFFESADNIQFNFSVPEGLVVFSDENYLQTIMQNLTANAVEALKQTPHSSIEWKAYTNNNKVYLSVTDNGPGYPENVLNTFTDDNTSIQGRTGLGLFIIRDMAAAIQCHVQLKNTPSGAQAIIEL